MTNRRTEKPVLKIVPAPDAEELAADAAETENDTADQARDVVRDDEAQDARDAAIGMSVIGKQSRISRKWRASRNAREKAVRAADKAEGIRRDYKSVSPLRKLYAVAEDPDTYALADLLPDPRRRSGMGRPCTYPAWVWMILGAGYEACGTIFAALTLLREPQVWNAVLDRVAVVPGTDEQVATRRAEADAARAAGPPLYDDWKYRMRLWARDEHAQALFHAEFRRSAVRKAIEQGRMDGSVKLSPNRPDVNHYAHADGVVVGSPSKALTPTTEDPDTGEILIRRYDNARGLHYQGGTPAKNNKAGGNVANGSKFAFLWNRGGPFGTRLVLDVRSQPAGYEGGEGQLLVDMFRDLVDIADGVHGILTDGILRGVHLKQVFEELGRVAISPVAAARRNKNNRRDFDSRFHQLPLLVHQPDGNDCSHKLWAGDGSVWTLHKQNKGIHSKDNHAVRCDTTNRTRKPNDNGTWRWDLHVRVPCTRSPEGHHIHRVGLAHPRRPKKGELPEPEFNRLEYLRLFGPADDVYADAYPRRMDAESGNRAMKRPFADARIPAYGHERQWLVMLLKAHTTNSVSRWLHRNPQVLQHGPGAAPGPGTTPEDHGDIQSEAA